MKKLLLNWLWLGLLPTFNSLAAPGDVWLEPATTTVAANTAFGLQLRVDSGTLKVGAYGVKVEFDATKLQVDTSTTTSAITNGANALSNNVPNPNNATGTLDVAGVQAQGVGPGSNLHLLTLNFKSLATPANAVVNVTVRDLTTENAVKIGTPTGWDSNVIIGGGAGVPTVTTNAATGITSTSATLNGSVTSAGAIASVSFDFGTTTTYGARITATPSSVYSASAVAVTASKTGLNCGTTYHYRVKAENSTGTSNGTDKTFVTTACTYTVTPTAGTGGTVSPSTAQTVTGGSKATFTVTPNTGYNRNSVVGGTCPQGNWNGNVWTTGTIVTNCSVNFGFTFVQQPINGVCGSANGGTFTTAPTTNLCSTGTVSGFSGSGPWNWNCTGSNGGTNASCNANLSGPVQYTVTPVIGANGNVTPSTPQSINPGALKSFTVTPNVGYIKNFVVGGNCPQGSWNENNKWTTGPITANCSVNFSFIEQPTAWLSPTNPYVTVGTNLPIELHVDTFGGQVASYVFDIKFDQSKLLVKTDYAGTGCQQGVCPGTNALSNISATPDNSMGKINLIGFDTQGGVGPSNNLHLVTIHFVTRQTLVTTQIELSLISMRSIIGDSIGNGLTGDSFVTIQRYKCGDSNGDSVINIIDALAIARQVVGLPPPPYITPVADVNGNGDISIVDAMHIARYSVGLVVVGTCLIQ